MDWSLVGEEFTLLSLRAAGVDVQTAILGVAALRKAPAPTRLVSASGVAMEAQRLRDAQWLMKPRPGGGGDRKEERKGAKGASK